MRNNIAKFADRIGELSMKKMDELFEAYRDNFVEWGNLDQKLMQNAVKEEWFSQLEQTRGRKKELYRSNDGII